jgi:hypothetical protein
LDYIKKKINKNIGLFMMMKMGLTQDKTLKGERMTKSFTFLLASVCPTQK